MTEQIELITVLKELHNISGFRISVYDTSFHEICAYPNELSGFCKYVQEFFLKLIKRHQVNFVRNDS